RWVVGTRAPSACLLAFCGCGFHAELAAGYQCPTGDCPAGQVCEAGVCVAAGDGGAIDAPAPGDGGIDPSLIAWWRFEDDAADGVIDWGTWQHFAATWDGERKRLFLDGSVVLDVPATLALDDSDIVIGADYHLDPTTGAPTGVFVQMVGALDELQVYDRVLSD